MTKKNKRNTKNSFKMTFKRWGTLAPQEHHREHDFYEYNDTSVKMGIFAFPEKILWCFAKILAWNLYF